jgi:hypothetical protein
MEIQCHRLSESRAAESDLESISTGHPEEKDCKKLTYIHPNKPKYNVFNLFFVRLQKRMGG